MDILEQIISNSADPERRIAEGASVQGLPCLKFKSILTLSRLLTTIVPYANSLDLDETPRNSASHSDLTCLTLRLHFHEL